MFEFSGEFDDVLFYLLFAMGDKLVFYSRSADAKPGRGTHERVDDTSKYSKLAGIEHWRRVLSNFHVGVFSVGGHSFMTIEHAFQFFKISLVDRQRALEFTIGSGTDLGLGNGEIAQRARKIVVLSPCDLAKWDVQKDDIIP